ncbi:MAG: winged helix-turn-helix transcriptional regulator, partial [Acidimicrobiia bacterium]|nr:winged helix-turn-helix transcriptional regulator [Acidimicrobiia bacterium]
MSQMNMLRPEDNGGLHLGGGSVAGNDIDETDQRIIVALRRKPRASVSELSRLLSLARGTVHTRLDRLEHRGVITGYGPDLNLGAAGYPVQAFTTLAI